MTKQKADRKNITPGVGYYNKEEQTDNIQITKYAEGFTSSSGLASKAALVALPAPVHQVESNTFTTSDSFGEAISSPTPPLTQDQIKRALIQLWDNGAGGPGHQRYKLKIRLNLVDGTDADFIAPLTKDPRNFIKHTADKDLAREYRDGYRRWVKDQWNVVPWLGKFHMVQTGRDAKMKSIQIEPNCFGAAWWDAENFGWTCGISIYDFFIKEFDLFEANTTALQRQNGCKAQALWINPKHDTRVRPKTWAELRAGK